jgi:hypothetical protein
MAKRRLNSNAVFDGRITNEPAIGLKYTDFIPEIS